MLKPLLHYQVLDLSCILAGPFAAQLLADLGAEVVKIEPPAGDPTRQWGPPFERGDTGESAYFRCANRGKHGLVMDLSVPETRERLHERLQQADVLIENFLPESAERLGLTWERLHARHPKLILASVRGFASDVPAASRPGYDLMIQAESGWMSLTGEPGGRPMKVGVALADLLAALYTANGVQAALLHRERTGEAIHVEVPLMEAALAGLVNVGSGTLMTGQPPGRWGNEHPNIVPYQTFACSDGEVAVCVGKDRHFELLALWLRLDLEAEPRWAHNQGRVADRERLAAILGERFAGHTSAEVLEFCEAQGIPVGRIRRVDDVLFRQAGILHHVIRTLVDQETGKMVPVLSSPILLNDERACAKLPPPGWTAP